MSCFYCGKRVSLVRKRNDADFCCDEHREKYHARTRRGIMALRDADEHIAMTRRLNEGIPLHLTSPIRGTDPEELVMRSGGPSLLFDRIPAGLPASMANLRTHMPAARLYAFRGAERNGAPPPPVADTVRWNIGYPPDGPRPPRGFTISIQLPQGGSKRVRQAPCDQPRLLRTETAVELGAAARAVARRIAWRPAGKSIGVLMRTAQPPDPVKPPPPSPPIVVTLRHPVMAMRLGTRRRPPAVSTHFPKPGWMGRGHLPMAGEERPPAPAYVPIVRSTFSLPAIRLSTGAMHRAGEPKWMHRFVPCPDGFRRRQFYSWEPLERFCGMGFETIAGHRPELRIVAAPNAALPLSMTLAWGSALDDGATAEPEHRRPAPPFGERLSVPAPIGPLTESELREAPAGRARIRMLDSRHHFPMMRTWDLSAGPALQRQPGELGRVSAAQWASGTAEALTIPAWARPQTRSAKRTACDSAISARKPVFSGPLFAAGGRQAGPSPARLLAVPVFEPEPARARSESVAALRAVLLPESPIRPRGLRQSEMLASACRAPVGRIPAESVLHPAYPILLPPTLPADHSRATAARGLSPHPPASWIGSTFDIAKGTPQLLEREALQRFHKRGYEAMRSRHTTSRWPAQSVPGLMAMDTPAPCPHPSRPPDREAAAVMFRSCEQPPATAYRRACTLMDWGTAAPAIPGSADWGRVARLAGVDLPLPLVLPIDAFGPIRDWGLARPAEPEKPPEPIHEDFTAGLANWVCADADWRQDIAGVRTGSLGLLRPSLNMSDYELEFLGKIENQSIGWVLRAADTDNYHAVQIVRDAASGAARLVRFSVLAGERGHSQIAPLEILLANSSSCRVRMSVSGDDFKLFINEKPAFDWSDDRLPEGGVGFFSEGDDRARLYWVKVTPYCVAPADTPYPRMGLLHSEIQQEIRIGV